MIPPSRRYRKGNGQPPRRRRLPGSIPLPDLGRLARARPDGTRPATGQGPGESGHGCGTHAVVVALVAAGAAYIVRRPPPGRPGRG